MADLVLPEATILHLARSMLDPTRARAFVREHLADLDDPVVYDATLLASELVTNAVIHGQLPAHLEIIRENEVRLVVRDGGPAFAYVRRIPSPQARSGRGMGIVAAVAKSWGMDVDAGIPGKAIWAEVDLFPDD